MMALSEMSQRRPDYSEKLASTVLTKAPQIVSSLQEFTQALNEKAGRAVTPRRLLRMDTPSSKPVLIVEDERDVVDLLTLNLRKAGGFIISTASDGASGLNKARTEKAGP